MVPETEAFLRQQIIDTAQTLGHRDLSPGLSGNVSARFEEGMLITPSAMDYDDLLPDDIVYVPARGEITPSQRKPSTESPFHQAIYQQFDEAQAVVHCHSPKATALACARQPIPAFHYLVAVAGGHNIPVADCQTPATEALASATISALQDRKACLLANHGQVAWGVSLSDALELAAEVENLAAMFIDVLSIGSPQILTDREMDDVLKHFTSYRGSN